MIRSVTPGDLWSLRRKPRTQVVLHTASLLVQPHQPFRFACHSFLQGNGQTYAMIVFAERGFRALVQARKRHSRPEQDIIMLATYGLQKPYLPSDYDIWFRLLERLIITAGHCAIQRLYAAVWEQHSELREICRQLSFQAYARRVILQLSGPDWDQGTTIAPMRIQSRQDNWAIHKLYGSTTPHPVQYADVYTPRDWSLPLGQRWHTHRRRAWVMGPTSNLVAYLHLLSGPLAHVFTLLIHPDERDHVTDVLRFGLTQLHDTRQVYLIVHEYQHDILKPAQSLGFQPLGDQTLMVKSTIVPARRSLLLSTFEPGLERRVTIPSIFAHTEESHSDGTPTRRTE